MTVAELERAPDTGEQPTPPRNRARARLAMVGIAAFFASTGAGWTAAGLFAGVFSRIVIVLAAAAGAGVVVGAARARRSGLWHAVGGIAILGLALVFFYAAGTSRTGPLDAVLDALRGGGPSGNAIAFTPGWRIILTVLIGTLAAGSTAIALSTGRPRLAVAVPVPVLIGASLVQPQGATLRSGIPSMALLLAGLVVAFGVDLVDEGAAELRFEARRLAHGAVAIVLIAGALAGVAQAHFLFPVPDQEQVIPPRLPPEVPPLPDRVLFTVRSTAPGPWRLGVLDVYDGTAWRLPPFDPARPVRIGADAVPGARASATARTSTFTIESLAGAVLPEVADAQRIRTSMPLTFDPRTQMLRLAGTTATRGNTYTITSASPPTGAQLSAAPKPPASLAEFSSVPPAPPRVATMLSDAPRAPLWDRLQYARTEFYKAVVAKGAGRPVAVPPARVDAILNGDPASPYEISAAETLIARWAGVPARIGYGFYGGQRNGATLSVHPSHAATWLEVYFDGYGWVPVVGVPPRARASLDQQRAKANPLIRPTDQLALVLYVPFKQRTIRLLYVVARFWLGVTLPIALALALAWTFFPGLLKLFRRARRDRWARTRGPRARVAVAYAALRDTATDLNVGDPALTPFGFADAIKDDAELRELTWLVSRALWGDLTRDLRDDDAEIAQRLARSVARRVRRAQPGSTRLLAIASRASLRDPYTVEIPNLWPARRRRARRLVVATASLIALTLAGSWGCARAPREVAAASGGAFPARLVPNAVGTTTFKREPAVEARLRDAGSDAIVDAVRVFTLRDGRAVEGYIEIGSFGAGTSGLRPEVRRGVVAGIGAANLTLTRAGSLRVYTGASAAQNYALWFAPEGTYFELLVTRRSVNRPLDILAAVLIAQGRTIGSTNDVATLAPTDPRRGMP